MIIAAEREISMKSLQSRTISSLGVLGRSDGHIVQYVNIPCLFNKKGGSQYISYMTQASARNKIVATDKNKSVATDKAIRDFTNTRIH